MQVHWSYFGCDKEHEERIQRGWETVQDRLEARVAAVGDEPAVLQIAVSHQDPSPCWHVQGALRLPGWSTVLMADGNDPSAVLEELAAGLAGELDASQDEPERVVQRRSDWTSLVSFLGASYRAGRNDAFVSFLTPLIGSLAPHVRRELKLLEMEGRVAGGQVALADVLNEVLVRAHQRWPRRPADVSLDLWLVQLASQVLDEMCSDGERESLDDEVEEPNREPRDSQRTSWVEWATFPETIERGELLLGNSGPSEWDELDVETKQTQLFNLLRRVPRHKRQCLMLHAVDGFSVEEIADFQGRSPQDVQADIEIARRTLESSFHESQWLDLQEQMDPTGRAPRKR